MLKEALNQLQEYIVAGMDPRVIRVGDDKALIAWPGGESTEIHFEPPPESHQLTTLQSFVDAVALRSKVTPDSPGESSAIFLSKTGATLVDRLDQRKHHLRLNLQEASQFTCLRSCFRRDKPLGQRDLLELLRHDLNPHAPESLFGLARKVEASSNQRGSSEVSAGRERGTMEFQAEIHSEIDIPERVQFHLPVFDGDQLDGCQWVDCSFRVTLPPGPVTFMIEPYPGEIERAYRQALTSIHALIVEQCDEIPVLLGTTELWQPGRNGFSLSG